MIDWLAALRDGLILALLLSAAALGMFRYNPRLSLNPGDMPPDVYARAGPKIDEEKRLAILIGIPLLSLMIAGAIVSSWFVARAGQQTLLALSLHALTVNLFVFFWDLLALGVWLFCTVTPKFMVAPGTEGLAGYKA